MPPIITTIWDYLVLLLESWKVSLLGPRQPKRLVHGVLGKSLLLIIGKGVFEWDGDLILQLLCTFRSSGCHSVILACISVEECRWFCQKWNLLNESSQSFKCLARVFIQPLNLSSNDTIQSFCTNLRKNRKLNLHSVISIESSSTPLIMVSNFVENLQEASIIDSTKPWIHLLTSTIHIFNSPSEVSRATFLNIRHSFKFCMPNVPRLVSDNCEDGDSMPKMTTPLIFLMQWILFFFQSLFSLHPAVVVDKIIPLCER